MKFKKNIKHNVYSRKYCLVDSLFHRGCEWYGWHSASPIHIHKWVENGVSSLILTLGYWSTSPTWSMSPSGYGYTNSIRCNRDRWNKYHNPRFYTTKYCSNASSSTWYKH